jgi:hypothetical protein
VQGKTLSSWLDLLTEEYGLADVLDILRMQYSNNPKYHEFVLKLEEAVCLALKAEPKP